MKNYRKVIATALALSMLGSLAACNQKNDNEFSSESSLASGETSLTIATENTIPTETTEFDITQYSFDTIYGSQLGNYINHQYYFNGEPVSVAESNFYFINAFYEFTSRGMYGQYPLTSEGYFDLSAPIDFEDVDVQYDTYGEYYIDYCEAMLKSTCIICKLAEDEGLTLSADTINMIEEMITSLDEQAGLPEDFTLDQYFQLYYGDACTVDAFRNLMQRYYLADLYTSNFVKNYEYTDEQRAENSVPVIRYCVFLSPAASATDDEMITAEELANNLYAACNGDIDTFATLGQESYSNGECLEYGELDVPRGKTVQAFEDWAWDEARTPGELGVIYAEEFGYFVVGFVGMQEDENALSDIAVAALGDYVSEIADTEGYTLTTNDPFIPAEPVVDETLPPETSAEVVTSDESTEG